MFQTCESPSQELISVNYATIFLPCELDPRVYFTCDAWDIHKDPTCLRLCQANIKVRYRPEKNYALLGYD